jgi:hypothetical protein
MFPSSSGFMFVVSIRLFNKKDTYMKTKMLIFPMIMIAAAAAAQTGIQADGSSKSQLTVKKNQAAVSTQNSASQQASVKGNKTATASSIQQQASLNRQTGENQAQKADLSLRAKSGGAKTISATEKQKQALAASASKIAVEKQGESKAAAGNSVKTVASVQRTAKAKVSTAQAATIKPAKVKSADMESATIKSAGIKSAKVKNAGAAKMTVKPHPVKINTKIRTVAAVKVI